MNGPVIFGSSDSTSSPNNLKHWTEWKDQLAKDNKNLTALFELPLPGHGAIMVLVLPEMFFPPGSTDPREVTDVLCIAGSSDGRFTHCMRSEEELHGEQKHNAFTLAHSYLTQQTLHTGPDIFGRF